MRKEVVVNLKDHKNMREALKSLYGRRDSDAKEAGGQAPEEVHAGLGGIVRPPDGTWGQQGSGQAEEATEAKDVPDRGDRTPFSGCMAPKDGGSSSP